MANQHLIESLWYSRSKIVLLLWPLHLVFLLIVLIKRFFYQSKLLSSNHFTKPVVVVGNITLGGTGKTPFINRLVRLLVENNIKPGIVSRGYKAKNCNYPHQVTPTDSAEQVGDEAFMQFSDLNQLAKLKVPIVLDPDRSCAVNYLIAQNDVDIVISDDGMQHYNMDRDIEVLLFDGVRQFGNKLILPFGPLREPVSRLKSVDFVVQNGDIHNVYSKYSVFLSTKCLVNLKTGEEISIESFSKAKVHAFAGIGNSDRFFDTLENICLIQSKKSFPDHHEFILDDFEKIDDEMVVMTEKDAVKCYSFTKDNWYYLKVEMDFDETLVTQLLNSIKSIVKTK